MTDIAKKLCTHKLVYESVNLAIVYDPAFCKIHSFSEVWHLELSYIEI